MPALGSHGVLPGNHINILLFGEASNIAHIDDKPSRTSQLPSDMEGWAKALPEMCLVGAV